MTQPIHSTLGGYVLERELGAGAMGVVYAAFDPDLERRIAIKVLRGATATVEANERLVREARAMARLAHPNVVTVYEAGIAGGRGYMAMELIQGETLAEWLAARKRPLAAILDAFLHAGRGLVAAHLARIVHRDFKPRNVLRGHDGRIAVTDFGLAREIAAVASPTRDAVLSLDMAFDAPGLWADITASGSLIGTPAYMAPEQWRGAEVTPATDQFAYCMALLEAIIGKHPCCGASRDELRAEIARLPVTVDACRIPRGLRTVLRRGLDPDPARRWPSMTILLERIARTRRKPVPPQTCTGDGPGSPVASTTRASRVRGRDRSRDAARKRPLHPIAGRGPA
jgi:serine/threonine protein kinase